MIYGRLLLVHGHMIIVVLCSYDLCGRMANDVCYDHYDHIIAMLVALPTLLCPEEDYGSIEKRPFLAF